MQPPSYLDDIQYIVRSIDIDSNGKLSFRGELYEGYDYPEASAEVRLSHNLTNLLYSACYTRSRTTKQYDIIERDIEDSFLPSLRAANASAECYDCGWTVDEIEHGGNILVHKGGYKRYTYAGDFIRTYFGQGPLQRGEIVNIRVVPEYSGEPETGDVFYFIFGQVLLDNNNETIVRLYFNLKPEGAASLVALISENLNRYNIPFQFKCLNRKAFYTRCDAAVLYIDKRYFQVVADLLAEHYAELKTGLNAEVPMFTKLLAPGIGFAENPFSSADSFGTSRCKIIAQGILDAWNNRQPKEAWTDFILKNIQKNYLRPEALYLNPNSKYPYHFPVFEN